MLQISQTEKPICSAMIDQIRLRRAMNLPFVFQNVSSSGFQSKIQIGLFSLINLPFVVQQCTVRALGGPSPASHFWDEDLRRTASVASEAVFQASCQRRATLISVIEQYVIEFAQIFCRPNVASKIGGALIP